MSNWARWKDDGHWLAGFSAWDLIKLKSRSCLASVLFWSPGSGVGQGRLSNSCGSWQNLVSCRCRPEIPVFMLAISWGPLLSLKVYPKFFAMWLPPPWAVYKMTICFFLGQQDPFSLTSSSPVSYNRVLPDGMWSQEWLSYHHLPYNIT